MYSILSVDGQEAAEKLLNETVGRDTELVHSHIETGRHQPAGGEQDNNLLGVSVSRFTFIFRNRI
jgi:hypothetical protein